MGYMSIKNRDESSLVLLREPSFFSMAVFVGFLIGIVGVFIFGSESLFFKIVIALCALGLSCFIVDNFEICEFNKEQSEVRTTSLHWIQYLIGKILNLTLQPNVVARIEDIKDVRVEEQGGNNSGRAYQVILVLESGVQIGVTEVFTTDDISCHEQIKDEINNFLKDELVPKLQDDADNEADAEDDEDGEDSTEDDFEQISQAELETLKEGPLEGGDVVATKGDHEVCAEEEEAGKEGDTAATKGDHEVCAEEEEAGKGANEASS